MDGSVQSRLDSGGQASPWSAGLACAALLCLVAAAGLMLSQRGRIARTSFLDQRPSHERLEAGFALYRQHCASCHGAFLAGAPGWQADIQKAPALNETGHAANHSDLDLFQRVAGGARTSGRITMPAFRGIMSDDEIVTVLSYIASWWPEQERLRRAGPDWVFPATCSPGEAGGISTAAGRN